MQHGNVDHVRGLRFPGREHLDLEQARPLVGQQIGGRDLGRQLLGVGEVGVELGQVVPGLQEAGVVHPRLVDLIQETGRRLREGDAIRVVVDHFQVVDVPGGAQPGAVLPADVGGELLVEQDLLVMERHVRRGQRFAVRPAHAAAQLKGERGAVRTDLVALVDVAGKRMPHADPARPRQQRLDRHEVHLRREVGRQVDQPHVAAVGADLQLVEHAVGSGAPFQRQHQRVLREPLVHRGQFAGGHARRQHRRFLIASGAGHGAHGGGAFGLFLAGRHGQCAARQEQRACHQDSIHRVPPSLGRSSVDAAEYSRLRLRPQSAESGYLKRYPVSGTRMRPPAPGPKSAEASATGRPPASSTRAV